LGARLRAVIYGHQFGQFASRPCFDVGVRDWGPIRSHFDPCNDGNGGRRIRAVIDCAMRRREPKASVASIQAAIDAVTITH
jgi:hypothetical protein